MTVELRLPETGSELYYCRGCGIVLAADGPIICRHGLDPLDPGTLRHKPRLVEPLPSWHPFTRA